MSPAYTFCAILSLSALAFSLPANSLPAKADPQAGSFHVVNMEISRDGKVVGKPQLMMNIGGTAVATAAKQDGYSVKFSMKKGAATVADSRIVSVELFFP